VSKANCVSSLNTHSVGRPCIAEKIAAAPVCSCSSFLSPKIFGARAYLKPTASMLETAGIQHRSKTRSKGIEATLRNEGKQRRTLTPRERDVFELLKVGKCDKEIAVALNIEVRTASFHVSNILRKLGLSRRIEILVTMTVDQL
jgi:DNA-binding NarL/FixJ family response regulator